jgi:hypothetical protein
MEKMSLTIMSNSWEVKPFFATVQSRRRENKCAPTFRAYTGDNVSAHRKCFTTWMLKKASHATHPLCSFGEEIRASSSLVDFGVWFI